MPGKFAIFAFAGGPGCFAHALLDALDMKMKMEAQGLPLCAEMGGHPSMAHYVAAGFQPIII